MNDSLLDAAAQYASHLSAEGRMTPVEAVEVVSRAVRSVDRPSSGSGMGSPALLPGTPLMAASSVIGTLGWLVYLMKG